jgi:hypothetical protein
MRPGRASGYNFNKKVDAMKMSFVVCNEFFTERVMQLLKENGIDYFTSWERAKGKGHGTEPHLGAGPYGSTNAVFMIAFEDEAPLEGLIGAIQQANQQIRRASDRIRLFQLPLDRII